ncbi:hypothetical protein Tco_0322908 [Tanacetum coccineum]
MRILYVLLEITPNLATKATGIPLSSSYKTMWTAKLRNDILRFQQHQGESLSEAWTHFKDLLKKVSHHGIVRWLQIHIFYYHVSFHLKCEIDRVGGGKLRNKNTDESLEIIENPALYDHEGWNDSKEFVKPVKAISTPQSTSKTHDRRLLKLEDQINFLLKGSQPTLRPSSTTPSKLYAKALFNPPARKTKKGPLKSRTFRFSERTRQTLSTRHTHRKNKNREKKKKEFKNAIFKQREEINDRMAEMFELLKELTNSKAPEKVLIREEAKSSVTKNVNSISLAREEEERNDNDDMAADGGINRTDTEMPVKEVEKETEAENGTKNKPIKRA